MRREVQPALDSGTSGNSPPYRVMIAPKGRKLLDHIHKMEDCFVDLKQFLSQAVSKPFNDRK
jgi:hypothetical protein